MGAPIDLRPRLVAIGGPVPLFTDDAALVDALRERHRSAVAIFYERYAEHVRRVLVRVLGVDGELDDVHHDVFARALASVHQLADPGALRGWITSVAVFTARTHLRARRRRSCLQFFAPEDVPERSAAGNPEAVEALRATYAVLDELPADERIAFALRRIDGMELTEVASACGVSLATIKRRLARAEQTFHDKARKHPVLHDFLGGGSA